MELNEEDGYWRVTIDLADGNINFILLLLFLMFVWFFYQGIYHYQYKVVTKSWFEEEPEPALPDNADDESKSKRYFCLSFRYL
jgi:hypothetical protein